MKYDVRVDSAAAARLLVEVGKQARFAASRAINDVAKAAVDAEKTEMRKVFDRPTPYVINSVRRTVASKAVLTVEVFLEGAGKTGKGSSGVDPNKVLQAEVFGGGRRLKRSEKSLQAIGILPRGMYVVPGAGAPLDVYGNVSGSFLVRLLSYFGALERVAGSRQNMTAKGRARLAKAGRSAGGYSTINGVQYFVSQGKLRDATQHLAPGIYSRRGIHGSDIKPVLLFVRRPAYVRRLGFAEVGMGVAREGFDGAFRQRFAEAMRSAR